MSHQTLTVESGDTVGRGEHAPPPSHTISVMGQRKGKLLLNETVLCWESHKGKTRRAQSALNERCCWGGMEEQGGRAHGRRAHS